ncbi:MULTISPECIES: LamG domain-containing protein [unclassified Bacillus (in: firmicutes)]|uniref:LamG domain-containing protein n=1 Tax=unclassified Bacillus (in: firmicutes) TaxID=185979 RepID=UPI001BE65035|nr:MULTISPECIES: LamG domain-containing protein [unclassified Bacillus (in: firmicutes)]MBT2725129.1 LamG domain-containing protein [Bacillus sp. ISL-46]MBT2744404.1 LamG domain-containing protein [Bacillus sp. ISL-77]
MAIVTDGLVGYWHYAQGVSGSTWNNIAPATTGSYNGTIPGAALQSDSMFFDGASYVAIPSMGLTGDVTIESWFTLDSTALTTDNPHIVGGDGNHVLRLNRNSSFMQYVLGTSLKPSSALITTANTWYHVAAVFTYATNSVQFYINGASAGSATDAGTKQTWNQAIRIGARTNSTTSSICHKGKIASVRFYNKQLSSSEVSQNFAESMNVGLGYVGTDGSTLFDLKQSLYQDSMINLDTKQIIYFNSLISADSKQMIYSDSLISTDTKQIIYSDSSVGADTKQTIFSDSSLSFDTFQQIYESGSLLPAPFDVYIQLYEDSATSNDLKVTVFANSSTFFDTEQSVYVLSNSSFDTKQSLYTDSSSPFDTRINLYTNANSLLDTKQSIYQDSFSPFDTLQEFFSEGVVGSIPFDMKFILYGDQSKTFDSKQVLYCDGEFQTDLKQAIYQDSQFQTDTPLVIYADTVTGFNTNIRTYSDNFILFDTKQVLFDH